MTSLSRLCLPLCALVWLPVSAVSAQQPELADQLIRCSEMKDTLRRLSCFDSVARDAARAKPAPQPAPAPSGDKPADAPAAEPAKTDASKAEPAKAPAPPPQPIREQKALHEVDAKAVAAIVHAMPASTSARYEADGALTLTFKSSELMKLVRR